MTRRSSTTNPAITVDRRGLKTALERCRRVIPSRIIKPVLECVRLSCTDGRLRLSATDTEIAVTASAEADGELPRNRPNRRRAAGGFPLARRA